MGTRPIPGLILLTLPGKREKRFHWAPGKATLFLFATANRPKAPTTTKIIIKRSSATAEKQRISYASLSRLANWGQNYYIISGLGGGTCPLCPPYGSAPDCSLGLQHLDMPQYVTSTPSLSDFQGGLNTFLFSRSFPWLFAATFVVPVQCQLSFSDTNRSLYILTLL